MTPILLRLKSAYKLDLNNISETNTIENIVNSLSSSDLNKLISEHKGIKFEYRAHCSKLVADYKQSSYIDSNIEEQINDAQIVAKLLKLIYEKHLIIRHEVNFFLSESQALNKLLNKKGGESEKPERTYISSKAIGDFTASSNVIRLFIARLRRFLLASALLTSSTSIYTSFINNLNKTATPAFLYLGWIFFIPRLLDRLVTLCTRTIYHESMSVEEKTRGWSGRFKEQIKILWSDLGNDLSWFVVGILNCFVLIGPLAPATIFLALGLQVCDVALAALKIYVDISEYNKIKNEYLELLKCPQLSNEEKNDVRSSINYLQLNINNEATRLCINCLSASMILISLIFTIPALVALGPVVVMVGGTIAVMTSFMAISSLKYVNSKKPDSDLHKLIDKEKIKTHFSKATQCNFFKPKNEDENKKDQFINNNGHEVAKNLPSIN